MFPQPQLNILTPAKLCYEYDMKELKKAIDEATSVIIVLPDSAPDRDYLAALQIQKIAPDKIHLMAPEAKETEWHELFGGAPQKKEFAIEINTAITPVDELRYEKDAEKLTIILTHRYTFNKNAIHFAERIPPADLLISLGFQSTEDAEAVIETLPRKEPARHIFFNGAQIETPRQRIETLNKLEPQSAGLLGRLMVRSREETELQTLWSFLTKDDFAKTSTTPQDIFFVLGTFGKLVILPRIVVILWQFEREPSIAGIIWCKDEEILSKMEKFLGHSRSSSSYIELPPSKNFMEAETSTRKLLRSIL